MTRPIKFRAYQKTPSLNHKPSLYEVTGLDFYEGDYGGGEVCLRNKKGEQWTEYIKDVVLEQYTGLKDKNGKEIYAGDIVKLDDLNGENLDEPVKIVFEGSAFIMRCVKHNSIIIDEYGTPWVIGLMTEGIFEVIGNIHENNELLGGKE